MRIEYHTGRYKFNPGIDVDYFLAALGFTCTVVCLNHGILNHGRRRFCCEL